MKVTVESLPPPASHYVRDAFFFMKYSGVGGMGGVTNYLFKNPEEFEQYRQIAMNYAGDSVVKIVSIIQCLLERCS